MAITRAQQVRQMLEDGGMLVSPSKDGKRPGYRRSNYDTSGGGLRSNTTAPGSKGPMGGGKNETGRDPMAQFRGLPPGYKTSAKTKAALEAQRKGAQETIKQQREDAVIGRGPYELEDKDLSLREKINRFGAQKFTNLRKNTLRNLIDYIASGRQFKYPAGSIYTDLTGKGLNLKPEEYLGLENVSPARLSAMFGQDIIGTMDEEKIRDISKVLGQDVITQSEFEQFYPNMNVPDDKGGPDRQLQETDPCKGPNPPAYCFINQNPTDPTDPNQTTDVFAGIAPRFAGSIFDFDKLRRELEEQSAADGGRIGFDNGGYTFEQFMQDKSNVDKFMNQEQLKKLYEKMMKEKEVREQKTMAADGGRIGAMEGGIMDLETGRQMYFLGKLVKKATRAVKKIAKSPLGKVAIGAAALKFGPAIFGKGSFNPFLMSPDKGASFGFSGLGKILNKAGLVNLSGGLTLGGKFGLGALTLPFLSDEKEEQDMNMGPELTMEELRAIRNSPYRYMAPAFTGSKYEFADGGRIGYQEGSKEPVAKKTMPLLDMGGKEMDLRDDGGFVPIGRMEKADDVPARLSKNEFVFTADAVRNAGDGDVDKGAEVMYNMMKNLESGGEVSEESQGLEGAREMFQTSKRLEEVL